MKQNIFNHIFNNIYSNIDDIILKNNYIFNNNTVYEKIKYISQDKDEKINKTYYFTIIYIMSMNLLKI